MKKTVLMLVTLVLVAVLAACGATTTADQRPAQVRWWGVRMWEYAAVSEEDDGYRFMELLENGTFYVYDWGSDDGFDAYEIWFHGTWTTQPDAITFDFIDYNDEHRTLTFAVHGTELAYELVTPSGLVTAVIAEFYAIDESPYLGDWVYESADMPSDCPTCADVEIRDFRHVRILEDLSFFRSEDGTTWTKVGRMRPALVHFGIDRFPTYRMIDVTVTDGVMALFFADEYGDDVTVYLERAENVAP